MSEGYVLFVGSCNRPTPYFASSNGSGLSVFIVDPVTLEVQEFGGYRDIENPTYLSLARTGEVLFATSEVFGWKEGLVTAFAFDKAGAQLRYLNTQPTLGSIAAQSIVSLNGNHLLLVNYGVGTGGPDQSLVIYPLTKGALHPVSFSVRQTGAGPDATRQERSHAHSVTEIAEDVYVVADLGCDTLTSYRLVHDGTLERMSVTHCVPASGPRHAVLHPSRKFLFVMNELNSTCASFGIDHDSGRLTPINDVSALPDKDFRGNHCADLQISSDGRFLYGSNRGHDSISIYSVSQENGLITLIDNISCAGKTPRSVAISPTGEHLFCANQDSDRVNIFERSFAQGGLTDSGRCIEVGTPTCVKFG